MDQQETIQDIRERLVKIEVLLGNMSDATKLQLDNLIDKLKVSNHRIDDLEKANTWLWRTIAGSLIAGVVSLLLK
ncbi:hemolysin XhlA family protein [Clostridium botulinum]|uniref:hemolysin XhlA family protein n=1 Tax=Clostridium botulinum TaxID=1491 RepID=UPI0014014691|nr:hemolysin XhlA family protein [Clostridium botulinum]MBY6918180.1 hemolysin XhlA family protein [Clostridium botulinum]NFQ39436.1 hemolysin XhlA [Clostridium botulinum]